jgi:manganese/iron transport system ATP-binding protein
VPTYLDLLRVTTETIAQGLAGAAPNEGRMRDTRRRRRRAFRPEGVTVTYRNGVTALTDASFAIPRGTITALVGVNGAGKSTLFKAIMGFLPLARGRIRLLGLPVRDALRQNLVAYVPQAEEVDWSFPVLVEDVVMMGRYGHMGFLRRPSATDRAKVDQALTRWA